MIFFLFSSSFQFKTSEIYLVARTTVNTKKRKDDENRIRKQALDWEQNRVGRESKHEGILELK